jgi:predicted Holliday junction resolvase-like endonuclease
MARGWESKSVEEQIGEAEAERDAQAKRQTSASEREQQGRRESLLLSRAQILGRLKLTQNERYRAQLESALKHIETQLQEADSTAGRE